MIKYFRLKNYYSRIRKLKKKYLIRKLSTTLFNKTDLNSIWQLELDKIHTCKLDSSDDNYYVFGKKVIPKEINWHQDKFSDFIYPLDRIDKLDFIGLFNRGIDLVFPWELSRFYFAPMLAQKYKLSNDENYYLEFRNNCLDWIKKNPFLYGVNWLSTMDVAIRAMNWIVAINIFDQRFNEDKELKEEITASLVMHGEYIAKFPAVYDKKLTTNHTVAAFAGLLIIALSVENYRKAKEWINQSVNGLTDCMSSQVYKDGVDFEGSICYHKLVTELFAYATIFGISKGINFPIHYQSKLFKMFQFVAAYLGESAHAPQIGDNDSGRAIILSRGTKEFYEKEDDHRYLLSLCNIIYKNSPSNCCDDNICNWLPSISQERKFTANNETLDFKSSCHFNYGGFYILKNDYFQLTISNCPIGQGGKGGHNNLDKGSFTLSINNLPVVVDPGSYCYSPNKPLRDQFRNYTYHNTLFTNKDNKINIGENSYWGLKDYYQSELLFSNNEIVEIKLKNIFEEKYRFRKFELRENSIQIEDSYEGEFYVRLNLINDIEIIKNTDELILVIKNNKLIISFSSSNFEIKSYDYSPHYGKKIEAKFILIKSNTKLITKIFTI